MSLVETGVELRSGSEPPIRMTWANATGGAVFEGVDRLAGQSNYFRGSDSKRWHTGIPQFKKVLQREVYPGIDVAFYGNGRRLEFDFVVSPGADPDSVEIAFDGTERVEISGDGDLVLHTPSGELLSRRPRVYQTQNGVEQAVDASYVFRDQGRVGFQLAEHDPSRALIIDPVVAFILKLNSDGSDLIYSTFLGGGNLDIGLAIVIDDHGGAYVSGNTVSSNFPTTTGAFQERRSGIQRSAFVAKLSPDGSTLEYGTYLGGSGIDGAHDLAVHSTGTVVVAGQTKSGNFPLTTGVVGPTLLGGFEAFVTHLSADGSALLFSTLLSGSSDDIGYAVGLDDDGNSYVAGSTASANFPSTAAAFQPTLAAGLHRV